MYCKNNNVLLFLNRDSEENKLKKKKHLTYGKQLYHLL